MTRSKHTLVERLDRDHRDRIAYILEPPERPAKPTEFKRRMWVILQLRRLGFYDKAR
jgi:hypothetical protein